MGRWRLPRAGGASRRKIVSKCSIVPSFVCGAWDVWEGYRAGEESNELWATNGRQKWWFYSYKKYKSVSAFGPTGPMAPGACWPPGSAVGRGWYVARYCGVRVCGRAQRDAGVQARLPNKTGIPQTGRHLGRARSTVGRGELRTRLPTSRRTLGSSLSGSR